MKKILLLSCLLLLFCLITGCRRGEEKMPTPPCPSCKDYSEDGFNGLPVKAATQMSDLYASNHYPNYMINGSMSDAKAIWFSLDSIKKFIFNIEKAMCKCDSSRELGIRIYFGEYPDLTSFGLSGSSYFGSIDPGMSKKHTLFMVPTYNYNNADYDFDPWHLGKGGCNKPTTLCEWFGTDSSYFNNNMLALAPDDSKGSKNHGNMCPPLCPEGSSCFGVSAITSDPKEKKKSDKK
ncbi:MAG: hypothetical protein ABI685_06320 [Ferruginibacter sp.]